MRLGKLIIFLAVLLGGSTYARELSLEEKVGELFHLQTLIKSNYGPVDLKNKTLKITPEIVFAKYAEAAKLSDNLSFFYSINRAIAEFHDSHFGSNLSTNHVSALGFLTDRVEGKVIIDVVDRGKLPEKEFPFERGDEVVSIGKRPVAEVIKELGSYIGMGNEESNLRYATIMLPYRPSAIVPPQTGKIEVAVLKQRNNKVESVEVEWKQTGDAIDEMANPLAREGLESSDPIDYRDISIFDINRDLPNAEQSFRCSGTTRTEIPKDAKILMSQPFVAYIHDTPKGKVGYLRIPHYIFPEVAMKQYEWAIDQMEKQTVGMVIDQDHNCGGSVMLVEKMVSFFAKKPFMGLQFQFLASRNEYLQFKAMVPKELYHTVEGEGFLRVLDLIKGSWKSGERLTSKITFNGNRLLEPNAIRYSKPVVILIDEMSGSGGDAFPALMQGLGLAKLIGRRTMGAGGHVVALEPLPYSGNRLRMTKSLFFHPNGTPIENNGVTPDVEYVPTKKDFLGKYTDYQKRYLDELLAMVK